MSKADAIEVFHYAGCSTCKKALKWLSSNGLSYEAIPIVERPPSARSLASWAKKGGLPVRKLVNVSGESYRALIATRGKEAVAELDDAALLALLAADGKMIKRPLLVRGDLVLVGFDETAYERALKA